MRQLFTATLFLLFSLQLFSQQLIKGRVSDEQGNAIQGAKVTLQGTKNTQTSKVDGQFEINSQSQKSAILLITHIGYAPQSVTVIPGSPITITLKSSSVAINEIIVTSLRASDKTPVAYTNISKDDIKKNNLGQDIPYLLSQTPSLIVSSDAGTGIGYTSFRIRGTDAARINVTINGIPYNDADEQGAYWVDLPDIASSLENLQIQRGVGTSTNGAAAFGANVNLQTESLSTKASAEANISGGSFNTLKATAKTSTGLMNNHWAIDTRISSIQSDGYIDRAWVKMKSYFVQAGYYGENSTLKFLTFGGKEQTYHAWDGIDSYALPHLEYDRTYNPCGKMGEDKNGNPLFYKNQTDNYVQTHYQLIGTHDFSNNLTATGALHYTRGDGYYEEYKGYQALNEYGLKSFSTNDSTTFDYSDLVRQKKMSNNFYGGIFSLNYLKDQFRASIGGGLNCYSGKHWGEVIWVKNYVGDLYPNSEYYRSKITKWDGNIYAKANYKLSNTIDIYGDLQYRGVNYKLTGTNDQWDDKAQKMQKLNIDKNFNFFNPKAGVYMKANDNNDLYASFAVAHREPTRSNYTDGDSNAYPQPETLYDTEIGWKYKASNHSIGVNAYYMNYKNQLVLTGKINDLGESLTSNIDKSFRSGLEFTGSYNPFRWLNWSGSVTYSYNRIRNFTETVNVIDENWDPTGQSVDFKYSNTPIAYSPALTANSTFLFSANNIELGLQSNYVGKQYLDNTGKDDRSLPSYLVNNIRISYTVPQKFISALSFSILVNNLFNNLYISNAWSAPSISEDKSNPVYNTNSTVNNYFGCYPQAGRFFLGAISIKF